MLRHTFPPSITGHSDIKENGSSCSSGGGCWFLAHKYNFAHHLFLLIIYPNMALRTVSVSVLSILIILLSSFPSIILCASKLKRLPLPSVLGPLAFAFDSEGDGPYTGVADGRILKYHGSKTGFLEYAQSSPIR